jgi:alpha-glucuronidase
MKPLTRDMEYQCWLRYEKVQDGPLLGRYRDWCGQLVFLHETPVIRSARDELVHGLGRLLGMEPSVTAVPPLNQFILVGRFGSHSLIDGAVGPEESGRINQDGYIIKTVKERGQEYLIIAAGSDQGILYGTYGFLSLLQTRREIDGLNVVERPANPLRMINHWDNLDGSIERGYAGPSVFYEQNQLTADLPRVRDYARLLASVGINGIVINNVNVHREETALIHGRLDLVEKIADVFRRYGIKVFLSINFAAPIELGGLATADPLDAGVRAWWRASAVRIYGRIPDFGGFLVKADSEHRPGPFTYRRNHAEGANMLAEALSPFGGLVIWRCFVYNCGQDWRDRSIDRAKAAFENFTPLDGQFADNVILQIKNGPMDFQVREPVSPLFGAMEQTNQMLELQITQEYTGQQIHLCYLVPQWKEVLDFDTYARESGSFVKRIADGSLFAREYCGLAGVANIGADPNWTGHTLAQANLYGFARLAWNPDWTAAEITAEWVTRTFGADPEAVAVITQMLLDSWRIYENYNAPLGIGWMVNPGHHYGPNVDGYEYSRWGTYHRADCFGIGIDRSVRTGTGYAGQYRAENALRYETPETCPDELLLFFHHLPYTHLLKSGKTVIQHIYDTHFDGVEQVKGLRKSWERLKDKVDPKCFEKVRERLEQQLEQAEEWRDVINTYFFRKTGIPDRFGRTIYH